MIRFLLTSLLLATACGRSGEPDRRVVDTSGVEIRAQLYESSIEDEWYDTAHCDPLMFSGLLGAARPGTIDLTEAEVEPGVWLRKPLRYGECSPSAGTSRSTISRDGILGVYWWAWRERRVDVLERLMESIRGNNYQLVGEGTIGELLLLPVHINTLAEMIHRLGGTLDVSAERNLRALAWFGSGGQGYERHIQIWHILLRGEVLGGLSSNELDRIVEHADAQQLNPLYAAAYGKWVDGDLTRAIGLLHEIYPVDRLPTSADYCPDWPMQRDNVVACEEEGRTHTGLDLVVLYRLILSDRENI